MDAKTETALRKSIAKWEENARAETPDDVKAGAEECPLCRMYHPDFGGQRRCKGCPVSARTGGPYCYGTPYRLALDAECEWVVSAVAGGADTVECKTRFHTAAQDMADFLASLLPEASQ